MPESKTVFGNICSRSAHPEKDSTEALLIIGRSRGSTGSALHFS